MSGLGGLLEMKTTVPCAGLSEEHLHVVCKIRGYFFLMKTEDGK